jgi:adenylate cyclase
MERRLTAILSADVVGYGRLMSADEAGTLIALKAHRKELTDPTIATHHGRIVKLMGDGALVEFPSVVEAVQCALDFQRGMAERNADILSDRRIDFRIGVNLGDVIIEGDDIYGDGVNVAARLQGLAEPGGICISGTAFDQVEGKLDCGYAFLGARHVKNIAKPVRIYRVLMEPDAIGKVTGSRRRPTPPWGWAAAAAFALLAGVGGFAAWYRPWEPTVEPASIERMAFPLPDKPSIAVLPFDNMSGDPDQEYFVDGMTDDLITALSKISGLFVIARNSTFVYKNKPVSVREVAESLGVRYVLEGSARRSGDQVRVNAQLIDATTGGHVWAEKLDGSVEDIFSIQDKFVRNIVDELVVNLSEGEREAIARGQTSNVDAREAFQRGWEHYLRFTPKENARAAVELKKAIELDPDYGRAYAALGLVYFQCGCASDWIGALGVTSAQAEEAALRYLAEAKNRPSSFANVAASRISLYRGRHEEAFAEAARAIALEPNDPEAHIAMAWAMITTGRPQAGLEFVETAMRLNPNYPSDYGLTAGMALFAIGELDEAARQLEKAMERDPHATELVPPLAATYAHLGRRQEARDLLLSWKPGAGQRELNGIPTAYSLPYKWSPDGYLALQMVA